MVSAKADMQRWQRLPQAMATQSSKVGAKHVKPKMFTRRQAKEEAHWDHGAVLVDKPLHWTSFDVCNKLRARLKKMKRVKAFKVGHAGTLDPMATGLLIVCTGTGTKWSDAFLNADKEYTGAVQLGQWTPSADSETPVEASAAWSHISDSMIEATRSAFVGQMEQAPPKYSAIKVNGEKLCDIVRRGDPVPDAARRPVHVYGLDLHRSEEDASVLRFHARCSKGTYIRTLAESIGEHLGSLAHLIELRRVAVGDLRVDDAWLVNELAEQLQAQQIPDRNYSSR